MPSQQYNQVPASFTPPTTGSGFSFGTDFVPTWLQINNPSSYYLTFPGSSTEIIPPYQLGVVIPWNKSGGNIVVSTEYTPPSAPTIPVSNAEVTILATDNPRLGPSPGMSIFSSVAITSPSFLAALVIPAGQISSTTSITMPPGAIQVGVILNYASLSVNNMTALSVTGKTSSASYTPQWMNESIDTYIDTGLVVSKVIPANLDSGLEIYVRVTSAVTSDFTFGTLVAFYETVLATPHSDVFQDSSNQVPLSNSSSLQFGENSQTVSVSSAILSACIFTITPASAVSLQVTLGNGNTTIIATLMLPATAGASKTLNVTFPKELIIYGNPTYNWTLSWNFYDATGAVSNPTSVSGMMIGVVTYGNPV